MKIENKIVAQNISMIRHNLGLTMDEFGRRVNNASKSNVSKWEKGSSLPNSTRIKRIAELGNISVNELLYGSDFKKYEAGKKVYDKLLSNDRLDNYEKKAMLAFDASETKKLIIKAVNNAYESTSSLGRLSKPISISNKGLFPLQLKSVFEEQYQKDNKTNTNLILKTISDLENITEAVNSYKYYVDSRETFSAQNSTMNFGIDIVEGSISEELVKEISKETNALTESLETLIDKYPDKGKKLEGNIWGYDDNDESGSEVVAVKQISLDSDGKIHTEKDNTGNLHLEDRQIVKELSSTLQQAITETVNNKLSQNKK